MSKNAGTPTKAQQQQFQANMVTSLGTMQPMAQMTNIAPAPQQQPQPLGGPMTPQAPGMTPAMQAAAPGTPVGQPQFQVRRCVLSLHS